MATRPHDQPSPLEGESKPGRITIDLLSDGRARIVSTCLGKPDSSYAPLSDERLPSEIGKLMAELRARLSGVSPK